MERRKVVCLLRKKKQNRLLPLKLFPKDKVSKSEGSNLIFCKGLETLKKKPSITLQTDACQPLFKAYG
jgi:hypothetical protein